MVDLDFPEEYQKGFVSFLGCKIDLSQRVLIPRQETEFWVEQAMADLEKLGKDIKVLDIFSGSGCVGIAVAKKLCGAMVDFADIDPKAIAQIKINLEINGIEKESAEVFSADIFKGIPQGKYDAILANPPYIDPERASEVQKSVLDYEPHAALFASNGGMAMIEIFLAQAKDFLKTKGFIYMEFDPLQKEWVGDIIKSENYSSFEFFKDQFDQWRFVKIIK